MVPDHGFARVGTIQVQATMTPLRVFLPNESFKAIFWKYRAVPSGGFHC